MAEEYNYLIISCASRAYHARSFFLLRVSPKLFLPEEPQALEQQVILPIKPVRRLVKPDT